MKFHRHPAEWVRSIKNEQKEARLRREREQKAAEDKIDYNARLFIKKSLHSYFSDEIQDDPDRMIHTIRIKEDVSSERQKMYSRAVEIINDENENGLTAECQEEGSSKVFIFTLNLSA